jgi:hypothetical protein
MRKDSGSDLLQLECTADTWLTEEVCETWNVSLYCRLAGDTNLLKFAAEVPLSHTLPSTSKVCLCFVLSNVRI